MCSRHRACFTHFSRELNQRSIAGTLAILDLWLPSSGLCSSCKLKGGRCLLEQLAGNGCALCPFLPLLDGRSYPISSVCVPSVLCPTSVCLRSCRCRPTAQLRCWRPAESQGAAGPVQRSPGRHTLTPCTRMRDQGLPSLHDQRHGLYPLPHEAI